MKFSRRLFLVLLLILVVGCGTPASAPALEPGGTRRPTPTGAQAAVEIQIPDEAGHAIEPADSQPTFTPITDTPTLRALTATATKTLTPTQTSTSTSTATSTATATKTRRPTLRPTLKATATKMPPTPTAIPTVFLPPTPTQPVARACCKICTTGKACGDSCIARSKTCHKNGGCACNG